MDYTNAFNAVTAIADEKRKVQDLEDLDHERAGVDVGRIARFLGSENDPRNIQVKKEREARQFRTMLELMLQDPEYSALWHEVDEEARNTQAKLDAFQQELQEKIAQTQSELDQMLDNAITLPDGQKAFMDENGTAWTEDGDKVDPHIASGIDWSDCTPHEDFLSKKQYLDRLDDAEDKANALQSQIGDIQNSLSDDEEPPTKQQLQDSKDAINQINEDLQELRNQTGMSQDFDQSQNAPQVSAASIDLSLPVLD